MLPSLEVNTIGYETFEVTSEKNKKLRYRVNRQGLFKRYSCTCPDWQYRRSLEGTNCKHIKAVLDYSSMVGSWIGGI